MLLLIMREAGLTVLTISPRTYELVELIDDFIALAETTKMMIEHNNKRKENNNIN